MPLNRALVTHGPNVQPTVELVPVPKLKDDYVLIKTTAVAINPADWQTIVDDSSDPAEGGILGLDYAGVVVEVGDESKLTRKFQVGDRLVGMALHCNVHAPKDSPDGAFANYIVGKTGLAARIPHWMGDEEAATFGSGITTIGQGLYQGLDLPWPETQAAKDNTESILIYGGSTSTGSLAIQFAKLSGLRVIATCSPHNFDHVKSLGADAVFDYRSPTCGKDINEYTSNKLMLAYDCIAEKGAPEICYEALSTATQSDPATWPKYHALLPLEKAPRTDVHAKFVVAYSAVGEKFRFLGVDDEIPEDYEYASKFWTVVQALLDRKLIRGQRVELREGGLEGIIDGMEELKEGKVSGAKLVYRLS